MADFDWQNIGFGYHKTNYNVRFYYRNGKWGSMEISSSEVVNLHMSATALHYGQECFEGLKAFRGRDGKIRVFRWEDNARRMSDSAKGILMPELPVEVFRQAIMKAIEMNTDFIPPYGSGASLYVRPVYFGSGPQLGVRPAEEYLFMVFVSPVGPYFKEGFKPVEMLITREFDRAAPLGTGNIKVGGNYAASLRSIKKAHDLGFNNVIYLDAREKKYIDECGPANFFGIKNNTYVTPDSSSILPSITNKSLMTLARDFGMKVEIRHIPEEELETFEEAGACGTAAVISPIGRIVDDVTGKSYEYCQDGKPGPVSTRLYETLRGIQCGDLEDHHNWVTVLDSDL